MKKILAFTLVILVLAGGLTPPLRARAIDTLDESAITVSVPSAVLMEKVSGEVIYAKNPHEKLYPASVTKVATLLLVVEEIEAGRLKLDDLVVCSAHAASMGGSQIWLEEGEEMTVDDLLKAVTVVSANDCAVALAEHIAGSEEAFVKRMNDRAKELGCTDTNFTNCTGLADDPKHVTSAMDIAILARALISHDLIKKYTTIWMDSLRGGASMLTNTNKLIRFYEGATGLKTGYTAAAGHCLAATAERNGVEYIAVVMHGATSAERFDDAKALLNYAFANYTLASLRPDEALPPLTVTLGKSGTIQPAFSGAAAVLIEKTKQQALEYTVELPKEIAAPVTKGQVVGKLTVTSGGEVFATVDIVSPETVDRMGKWDVYKLLLSQLTGGTAP